MAVATAGVAVPEEATEPHRQEVWQGRFVLEASLRHPLGLVR
jgi:hypothetical protein